MTGKATALSKSLGVLLALCVLSPLSNAFAQKYPAGGMATGEEEKSLNATSEMPVAKKQKTGDEPSEEAVAEESSDSLAPWRDRWQSKRIGFHISDVNEILKEHIDKLLPGHQEDDEACSAGKRIFVPLCGKTVDMAYLAPKTKEVIGVEGIQLALEEFAGEHPDLKVKQTATKDGYVRFEGDSITLLKGDYFALDATKIGGKVDAIWDRASMVAIPPALRKNYVDVLGKVITPGGRILLVSLERQGEEEATKRGPPFSMADKVVRGYFERQDWVESMALIQQTDQLEKNPEDRKRYEGLDKLLENVYLITVKSEA